MNKIYFRKTAGLNGISFPTLNYHHHKQVISFKHPPDKYVPDRIRDLTYSRGLLILSRLFPTQKSFYIILRLDEKLKCPAILRGEMYDYEAFIHGKCDR